MNSPHFSRSKLLPLIVITLIAILVTSLTVTAQGRTELRVGISNNVDTLDPNVTTFSSVGVIMLHVFEPLVWQDPLGSFHPGLAASWEVNENATEYTFTLKEGVTFHDGTPVNSEAVKFTFDRIKNPDTASQLAISLLGPYAETVVVDDLTFTVKFNSPYAPFLNSASTPYLAPSSPTAIAEAGTEYGLSTVTGAGAFVLESYVPNSEVVLARNDAYAWGSEEVFGQSGAAALERIVFKIIQEPATRLAALESGEVDFIDRVPELDVERLSGDSALVVEQIPQPGHGWSLMMNVEKFPTNDVAVRRAVALASDKQGLIDIVFNGFGTPGCSALTKVMFGYDPATCDYLPFDREQAKAVLEAAGWVDSDGDGVREKDGERLVIQHFFRADNPLGSAMATYLQGDLAQVGIEVNLNGLTQSGYFEAVRAGQHNSQNWWDTWTDPDGMRVLFDSSRADGGTNRNRYRSEAMDAILLQAASASDSAARAALYAEAQKLAADDAVMVYFVDPILLYGYSSSLSGIKFLGGGNLPNFYASSFAG